MFDSLQTWGNTAVNYCYIFWEIYLIFSSRLLEFLVFHPYGRKPVPYCMRNHHIAAKGCGQIEDSFRILKILWIELFVKRFVIELKLFRELHMLSCSLTDN